MKLRTVVLEAALPMSTFGASSQEQWAQAVPTARFITPQCELDYEPSTGLVRIKKQAKTVHVHVSRVSFMELDQETLESGQQRSIDTASVATSPDPLGGGSKEPSYFEEQAFPIVSAMKKRRGMPKGGWPKKVPAPLPGALGPPKDPVP